MHAAQFLVALAVLASAAAALAERLRLPPPPLLVLLGVGVGLLPGVPSLHLPAGSVAVVVLPPLLFAAGEELPLGQLRSAWAAVSALSIGLVALTAVSVAAVTAAVTGVSAAAAFVLGAVLASTDPVAVTALARRLRLPPRVATIVQAESLFNDATSLVLFQVAVGVLVAGGRLHWAHLAGRTAQLGLGGVAVGMLAGVLGRAVLRGRSGSAAAAAAALLLPYGCYVAAEAARTSGVSAVVVASLVLAARRRPGGGAQAEARLARAAVFATTVFVLESSVFAVIGLELPAAVRGLGPHRGWVLPALAVTATLLATRLLWVFPAHAISARRRGEETSLRVPLVVTWAGTRGVVPLAAALTIPAGPDRDLLLVLASAAVVLTLVVQGTTLAPLVSRLRLAADPEHEAREEGLARAGAAEAGLAELESLAGAGDVGEDVAEVLRGRLRLRARRHSEPAGGDRGYARVRRAVLEAERAEVRRLLATGRIGEATARRVLRDLDLEDARLADPDTGA